MSLISVSNLKRKIKWKNVEPEATETTDIAKMLNFAPVHSNNFAVNPDNPLYWELSGVSYNREICDSNVKKIVDDIKNGVNILDICVVILAKILVDEKYELKIVDGQHRVLAARTLGIPYYVRVDENYDPRKIISINNNRKNWTLVDWLNHHLFSSDTENRRSYVIFNKLLNAHEFLTIGTLVAIFEKKTSSQGGNKHFKSGRLHYGIANADDINKKIRRIADVKVYAKYTPLEQVTLNSQAFQYAMLGALANPKFNYKKFLDNLGSNPHNFNTMKRSRDLILNEIYRIEKIKTKKKKGK